MVSVPELHKVYCAMSGMDVPLRFNRESSWVDFIRSGFTQADLESVLKRLLRLVHAGERRPESLKFSNVVEQLDRFEEELAMIRAEAKGLVAREHTMSVMELYRIMEAKQAMAEQLANKYANEDAFGKIWTDDAARTDYTKLRHEMHSLQQRISQMA